MNGHGYVGNMKDFLSPSDSVEFYPGWIALALAQNT